MPPATGKTSFFKTVGNALGSTCGTIMEPVRVYTTNKEVKLLDRKLGLLYFAITSLVLGYVIGVRLVLDKGYEEVEQSFGVIGVEVTGSSYAKTQTGNGILPVDAASLLQLDPEAHAVFIPTRWVVWPEQRRGYCSSPDEPCEKPTDCPHDGPLRPGTCTADGMCSRFQWCVPGVDGKYVGPTAPSDPFASEQYAAQEAILQGLDHKHDAFRMQIVASVSYPQLDGASSSVNTEGKARVRWTIAQIIHRAGMTVETAQKLGGVLSARLRWNCALPIDGCQPTLIVTQLAPGRPFYREYANYYRHAPSDNTSYRELYQARGLRILVTVEGIGHKVSLYMIMLQIFVLLTLGTIASMLADTIMLYAFAERRHYREYKTELSPDFSDVRAKVEQLEKQSKSQQYKAMEYVDA